MTFIYLFIHIIEFNLFLIKNLLKNLNLILLYLLSKVYEYYLLKGNFVDIIEFYCFVIM
jgi:hypothetical protein